MLAQLRHHPGLTQLEMDLMDCNLLDADVAHLSSLLHAPALTHFALNVRSNPCSGQSLDGLLEGLKHAGPRLRGLDLALSCLGGSRGAERLADCLRTAVTRLENLSLDLDCTGLGDEGLQAAPSREMGRRQCLLCGVRCPPRVRLGLAWNGLGAAGVQALCNATGLTGVQDFVVGLGPRALPGAIPGGARPQHNRLDTDGAVALLSALTVVPRLSLNLEHNVVQAREATVRLQARLGELPAWWDDVLF